MPLEEGDNLTVYDVQDDQYVLIDNNGLKYSIDRDEEQQEAPIVMTDTLRKTIRDAIKAKLVYWKAIRDLEIAMGSERNDYDDALENICVGINDFQDIHNLSDEVLLSIIN